MNTLIELLMSLGKLVFGAFMAYVFSGMLYVCGCFGHAIRNYATNWPAAIVNFFGLAATIAGMYYFLAAPLPMICISVLVIMNFLSIVGIRGTTFDENGSVEFYNDGPDVTTYYRIGRWVIVVIWLVALGYKLYDPFAGVFAR